MMQKKADRLRPAEVAACVSVYMIISLAAAWLFYDSIYAIFLFVPFFLLFVKTVRKLKIRKLKEDMSEQFIKTLTSVSASLFAGLSPENAFLAASSDMEKLYGKRALIVKELNTVNRMIMAGQRLTDALEDLSRRWQIQELSDFSIVFSTAVRNGGDMPEIIMICTGIMEDRCRTEEEARILIRGRRYEQRVMSAIPPMILAYLRLSSGSFLEILYHNPFGVTVMTLCLAVYVLAICLSEKIGDIRV